MVGRGKDHFEMIEAENTKFEDLMKKCKEYAAKRRLEENTRRGNAYPLAPIPDANVVVCQIVRLI